MKLGKENNKEFENLYKKHFDRLLALASRYSLSKENAEDALHDSFIIIFRKIVDFSGSENQLKSWMNKIVVNKCFEISRRRNRIKFKELLDEISDQNQEPAINAIIVKQLKRDIDSVLNYKQKIVFDLKEIDGFSHGEISTILRIEESHSRTILTRAKSKLKIHFSIINSK